jgi:molybdopterin synthase sulfur carrier subunit
MAPKITVRMYTILKEQVGCGKVDLEGSNVAEVLDKMKEMFGERFMRTLYEENGKVKGYYILLLNGKVVDHKKLKTYKLKDGDTLHIFPPIAGG